MNLENDVAFVPVKVATLAVLHQEAQARQLPTVLALLDQIADEITVSKASTRSAAQAPVVVPRRGSVKKSPVLGKAVALAQAVPSGELFSLGRLLPTEADWEGMPRRLRSAFGRKFRHELEKKKLAEFKGADKDTGTALYKRT